LACLHGNEGIDFLDGRVAGEAHAAMARHVTGCPACRDLLCRLTQSVEATCTERDDGTMPAARAAPSTMLLARGELVAERYRVLGFIARGGMGEVYQAEDTELGERVALKVLATTVHHEDRLRHFKREVQLARKVTHPNVCRLFDLGFHRRSDGDAPGRLAFLTMELVNGETLRARVGRLGPLSPTAARPLIAQMVAALAAAHGAGVIHRDFKCSNVMLADDRVVVTDFGLATPIAEEQTERALTIVGSPAYMAPEQLLGEPLGPAADIYALGVVLYELLTGRLPFVGVTSMQTAHKRLIESPPPPRSLAPALSERWERAILRCLEREPARRFADVSELLDALDEEPVRIDATATPPARPRRWWGAAALALTLALAAAVGAARWHRGVAGADGARTRDAVAVTALRSLGGEPESAWLSTALAEMLRAELAGGGNLRVVPGDAVARAELECRTGDGTAPIDLDRLGARLGARFLLSGSFAVLSPGPDPPIRVTLSLRELRGGAPAVGFSESGRDSELFDVVARLGTRLRFSLGTRALSARDQRAVRSALPSSPEGLRLYAEALARHRRYDETGARALAEQAIAKDPQHPLPHLLLSLIWDALDYHTRSREEASLAFARSSLLAEPERLTVEARYRQVTHAWKEATRIYQRLNRLFPDDLEILHQLVDCLEMDNRFDEAAAAIERFRHLPSPLRDDPELDFIGAWLAEARHDGRRMLTAAGTMAQKAQASGATLLLAEARRSEAVALLMLGEHSRALSVAEESRALFAELGNRNGEAKSILLVGSAHKHLGHLVEARAAFGQVEARGAEAGNLEYVAFALNNHANVEIEFGNYDEGLRLYERAAEYNRETGDARSEALALANAGESAIDAGRLRKAREYQERALAIARTTSDRYLEQQALGGLSFTRAHLGDVHAALDLAEQARAINRELGDYEGQPEVEFSVGDSLYQLGQLDKARQAFEHGAAVDPSLGLPGQRALCSVGLAEIARASHDLDGARRLLADAKALFRRDHRDLFVAETDLDDARLLLEEGHDAEALAAVRATEVTLTRLHGAALLPEAERLQAEALLRLRRRRDARAAFARAGALAVADDELQQLDLALTGARLALAEGRVGVSMRTLAAAIARARRAGSVAVELEALERLGEAERAGRRPLARAHLEDLRRRAGALGFVGVAARAQRLLSDGVAVAGGPRSGL
jgi:tetratricopeptide (TPR) repeat protein/TolB-like protein